MFENLTQAQYDVLLRGDLTTFAGRCFQELNPQTCLAVNWHLEIIAAKLTAVRQGKIRRLIINLPPRHLKSLMASIAFPAWCLGHDPTVQILCVSYAQDLADKLARDCRGIMMSPWYRRIFPTRLALHRQAVQEFITTRQGYRLATSTGGVLTGRGADIILIDDPLKPEEALSDTQRQSGNEWFDHTLYSRLNDKRHGAIVIIMQRLHEDDLVGHVLAQEDWEVVRFPAIAEADEAHEIETILQTKRFRRRQGEALHPEREPLEVLDRIRRTIGEYHFAGQYQQSPAPLGGGLVKLEWFKRYRKDELPERFDRIVQSWDTANKATELSDFSVCTTWGAKGKELFLLNVFRRRLEYPALKRAVREQQSLFDANVVLIEDKASGTQLIQELIADGCHGVTRYQPTTDKVMRLHAQTALIENGFVRIPAEAPWLAEYLHELTVFPKGKHDDQADSTAQFLDWYKKPGKDQGYIDWLREAAEEKNKQRQPEPREPNYAIGSVQWEEKQKKRRAADLAVMARRATISRRRNAPGILTAAREAGPVIRWLNWLSSFNGGRLSELVEADTRDIVMKEGVWVMEIKKTIRIPDQRRKTKVSSRDAPLHSALLAEGFLEYVESIKKEYGDGPLFPQVTLDAYGRRNGKVSKPISKWLRNVVGIKDPRKPFHSHRHTATSYLRNTRLPDGEYAVKTDIERYLLGHSEKDSHAGYGKQWIETLKAAIEVIPDPLHAVKDGASAGC